MCILMSSNVKQSRTFLTKTNGFDQMKSYLINYTLSLELSRVILGVGTNVYQCNPVTRNNSVVSDRPIFRRSTLWISEDSLPHKAADELAYPETIRLMFDLLTVCRDTELVFQVLADVKRLLTPDNMRILWEHNWLDWIATCIRERAMLEPAHFNRFLAITDTIVQKMVIYDISRKNSVTTKCKGALSSAATSSSILPSTLSSSPSSCISASSPPKDTDNEGEKFELRIIDIILSYYDKNPNVNIDTSNYIFRNLLILYRHLDDHICKSIYYSSSSFDTISSAFTIPSPSTTKTSIITTTSVRRHFVSTINTFACHNDAAVRAAMKSTGLFKIRDILIRDYKDLASNEFA
jgi:hypothetical protein